MDGEFCVGQLPPFYQYAKNTTCATTSLIQSNTNEIHEGRANGKAILIFDFYIHPRTLITKIQTIVMQSFFKKKNWHENQQFDIYNCPNIIFERFIYLRSRTIQIN